MRVIRACRRLGIESVAIYSEADRDALHVRLADQAWPCGPARATESYLDLERVVGIAKRVSADAVHPGYGFLSENAVFAEALKVAGIVFIGPSPEVMRTMGLKVPSREQMIRAGVPVVPGGEAIESLEAAREAAAALGYPVLVKASAGGGGRGMRLVEEESGLEAALERGRSEAESAFGDGSIYLEKYLLSPRHIEIQILADSHAKVVHLGERECSIQRRHQKVVEEAPAYGLNEGLRAAMGEAAVRAARSVDYVGAGTCEFLLDAHGEFYFLEMNTRIQVEHPVTEAVTGIDLVEMQLRIAAGEPLPFEQDDIGIEGHAIEARVYAEDPAKGFIPSPGRIEAWSPPGGPGIRLDAGFEAGQTVSSHYDPMLAKLIACGRDRAEARGRLAAALEEFQIAGLRTGLPFLRQLVEHPVFCSGRYDTGFIEAQMGSGPGELEPERLDRIFGALALRAMQAAEPDGSPKGRFEIALPKTPAVSVELVSDTSPAELCVGERRLALDLSTHDGVLFTLLAEGEVERLSVIEKKQGTLEVGLRDRVLRVKCKSVS